MKIYITDETVLFGWLITWNQNKYSLLDTVSLRPDWPRMGTFRPTYILNVIFRPNMGLTAV